MKRLDVDQDEDSLIELLENDPIGRNAELNDFAELLMSIEGGFTFFIDSDWGNGKTVFVRQLKIMLDAANPQIRTRDDVSLLEIPSLSSFDQASSFLPIYYNAWENDYWNDPLPTLGIAIASSGGSDFDAKESSSGIKKVSASLDAFLGSIPGFTGFDAASKLYEGWKASDLIASYRKRLDLRERISDLISAVKDERANTVLLIIDELDRCKPDFALRLLEEIKTLFNDENLIIACSVNLDQLSHVVEGAYGPGTDGHRYLARFYDLKLILRKVSENQYLSACSFPSSGLHFDKNVHELVGYYGMSMRDTNLYLQRITSLRERVLGDRRNEPLYSLFGAGIMPAMIAMSIMDPVAYRAVVEELKVEPILKVCEKALELKSFLIKTSTIFVEQNHVDIEVGESAEAIAEQIAKWLVICVFSDDSRSESFYEAYFNINRAFVDTHELIAVARSFL